MKYEIKWERTQRGKKIDWEKTEIIEYNGWEAGKPKVGEGKALLVDPPIYETIVSVREIKENEKGKVI